MKLVKLRISQGGVLLIKDLKAVGTMAESSTLCDCWGICVAKVVAREAQKGEVLTDFVLDESSRDRTRKWGTSDYDSVAKAV